MATTETIAQHAGSAITDFGEAQPGLRAEIAEDCSSATVIWIETLNWHREYDGERFATLQDTDGSFTSEASKEMADYVKEFLAESEWNVPNADIVHEPGEEWDDEDEPNVAITYRFGLPRGRTPLWRSSWRWHGLSLGR